VPAEITGLVTFVDGMKDRTGTTVAVSWDGIKAHPEFNGKAEVSAVLVLTAFVNDVMQEDRQDWTFTTEHSDGWRVCDAHKV
jgi:hypothetical protein